MDDFDRMELALQELENSGLNSEQIKNLNIVIRCTYKQIHKSNNALFIAEQQMKKMNDNAFALAANDDLFNTGNHTIH